MKRKDLFFVLALLGICALYFGIRLTNLTSLPVFVDEAIYVRWAQVMRAEPTLRFLPLSDGKQPLFMWIMIPFFKIFSDPLFAGRFVSVLSGFGTLIGIFLATYLLFKDKKISFIAAFIYTLSPFTVFFDRMALVDSMLTMFGVWIFLGMLFVSQKPRLDAAMITGFFLGGALLTKSSALFFVIMLPLFFLFIPYLKKRNFKKGFLPYIKFAALLMVSVGMGYGMYNILRLGPNFHLVAKRNLDYVFPLSQILTSPLHPFILFIKRDVEYFLTMGPGIFIFLSIFGLIFNLKKEFKKIFVVGIWAILPLLAVTEYSRDLTARYILFTIPFFVILAASSFLAKNINLRKLLVVGLLVFVAQSFYIDRLYLTNVEEAPLPRTERRGYLEEWTSGTGIKETAELILEAHQENPDESIIVGTEGYFGTLPDGLQIYLNQVPNVIVIGVGLGHSQVPKNLLNAKEGGNITYFVVNSTRFFGKGTELGMNLLAAYPKAVQPDGSRETLLFYEVTNEALNLNPKAF